VVTAVEAAESPASVAGTWSEGDSTALTVSLPAANITAKLGEAGSALTSDGGGNWTLALAQKLAPGAYDVVAESTDRHGRVSSAMAAGAIVVKQPAPPPRDCAADLARISMETPIRFRFKRTILQPPYDTALGPYVALLNDPACTGEKVEITGHADYLGSTRFNQYLSELRANYVLDALVKAGIDGARLSVKGFSENMPLVPAKTKEAREKNRRVEFTLVK
jgi:outer membrane protein OmpA-like peptidoglycan-associated protein